MKRPLAVSLALAALVLVVATFASVAPTLAQTTTGWTGSYFANAELKGTPAFTRTDPNIDFAWGAAAPDPNLPASNFSVRWVRWLYFDTPGLWTLTTIHNDGVRLYVDDGLVIDAWSDQAATAHTVKLNLTQAFHLVRMEYYSKAGPAEVRLQLISANFPDWRGEYFGNPNLTGAPAFVRNDGALNFNFGTTGPGGGIAGENFSARWTRGAYFDAGRYRITTLTDDGVRLWVDNQLLVDQWRDQVPKNWSGDITLATGEHLIKMEYFQRSSAALAVLTWLPVPGSAEIWRGEYFNNTGLTGAPALVRDDTQLNFDWGTSAPGPGIANGANWSARFTSKRATSLAGYYTVSAAADDGVRVYVDNNLVIDHWHDQPPTIYAATVYLNAGVHDWRVEYYQHTGAASLRSQIASGVTAPPLAAGTTPRAIGDVIVDDQSPGFVKSGWRDHPAGHGNHAFSAQNNTFSLPLYNWARWYPELPRAGYYEVAAYIPGNLATTRNARYWIEHALSSDIRALNQALYANQWVALGTYYFAATGDEYVSLADITYEPQQSTVVAVDAIRFSPR
ncbi:MAG: hypothetical protein HY782_01900 [Chloroflexi bacterium]|nr:hypothetical protein [Chloroflexota bacterium]